MNTREKAAKALYDLTALYSDIPWTNADDECRAYYLTRVDAVLNAIRPPGGAFVSEWIDSILKGEG